MAELDTSIYRTQPHDQLGEINKLLGVAQGVTALQSANFDLARRHMGAVNQVFGAIAADPSLENVASGMTALRQLGAPPEMIAEGVREFSQNGNDPKHISSTALRHIQRLATVDQQMQAGGMAPPALVNNGNQMAPYITRSGLAPSVTRAGGAAVPMQTSPGERMATDQAINPLTNETMSVPRGPRYDLQGYPKDMPAAGNGAFTGSALPPGAMVTGQAPGAAETQLANAQSGLGLQKRADTVPSNKAMIAQLETDLDQFTSGPGADWQNVAKAWANRNVLPGSLQFDPKSIASQEQFNKQAVMIAQQQFQALGGTGTDNQLSSTMKTSPNATLSAMGNRGILQLLNGNEDAIAAKNDAWQKWKATHGAGSYDQFQTAFNQTYNPLVFQAQYMNPEEIQKLRSKLSPKEEKKFQESYRIAKQNGWLGAGP